MTRRTHSQTRTDATTDAATTRDPVANPALAAIAPASALDAVLDAATVVVDECIVAVTPDGLAITAIDAATVGMVDLELDADAFDAYDATEFQFGVDLERLQAVVAMAGPDGTVELVVDDDTRELHVRIGELAYTLALLDPDAIRSPPDTTAIADDLDATVTVDGDVVARVIDAADMVASTLALGVDTDDRTLYAHADGDTDTVDFELDADDCHGFDPSPAHSLFSVDYLAALTGVLPSDDPVDLALDEDAPVTLSYDVADGAGRVQLLVVPRLSAS